MKLPCTRQETGKGFKSQTENTKKLLRHIRAETEIGDIFRSPAMADGRSRMGGGGGFSMMSTASLNLGVPGKQWMSWEYRDAEAGDLPEAALPPVAALVLPSIHAGRPRTWSCRIGFCKIML